MDTLVIEGDITLFPQVPRAHHPASKLLQTDTAVAALVMIVIQISIVA